jgi:hypothetical protein
MLFIILLLSCLTYYVRFEINTSLNLQFGDGWDTMQFKTIPDYITCWMSLPPPPFFGGGGGEEEKKNGNCMTKLNFVGNEWMY